MAIISRNDGKPLRSYQTSQLRYAFSYIILTMVFLFIMNIYSYTTSQRLFYEAKEEAMIDKCLLASGEIAKQDVLSPYTVQSSVKQMDGLKISRLIVTDQAGLCLYDSSSAQSGHPVMLPEILKALEGNDVFSWNYRDGAMISRAATPIQYYGTTIGAVYMVEADSEQGEVIRLLQKNMMTMTVLLEIAVIFFSLVYSQGFSSRIRKIMHSMRNIEDTYSSELTVGGNDELTLLADEFNNLTKKLQTSEEKRNRFVSDASHELKTPLASIKLLTDSILQNEMDTDTMREFVGDIGSEADRLTRMTEKLLSLARLGNEPEAEAELIHVIPTVEKVTKMLTPVAQKAEVTIDAAIENDCEVLITEDDLYQVIFNLMENGIKYNRRGGRLTVKLENTEDMAVLTVSDTGMGVPEEAAEHIFERFYRVDKARSRASGGTGLGLAIVRAIVQRNRGEISMTSTPGEGSTFTVKLPNFETEDGQS